MVSGAQAVGGQISSETPKALGLPAYGWPNSKDLFLSVVSGSQATGTQIHAPPLPLLSPSQ